MNFKKPLPVKTADLINRKINTLTNNLEVIWLSRVVLIREMSYHMNITNVMATTDD